MSNAKSIVVLLILVPLTFAGIWSLQHSIDAQRTALHQEQDDLELRSGKLLKAMSLEYDPLMADIYWTRVVQYYGDKSARHDANIELLWPLLDITTTLDPNLVVAYRFGATFLSERKPHGAGRPDQGVALLERGIAANPDEWKLNGDLGFLYYFNLKDYPKASAAFLEGSKKPEAMIWMKVMAARIAAEGESLQTSIFLWNEVYQTAKDPTVKKNAERHLHLLQVEQDCKQIDALGDEYEKRFGRRPARMNELVQAGLLRGLPIDPLGYTYVLGEDGRAELNLDSPLLEEQVMSQPHK
jgi:hypothetical protein